MRGFHFDEVEFARIGIHQIFDGSRPDVVRGGGNFQRITRQFLALCFGEVGCRCAFDHLLVTALNGAVTLEEVNHIAMRIAKDLAFHVAGALDKLFEIDFILAEGRHRFALASVTSLARSASERITRMPRPPPPQDAFSMTG